MTSTPEWEQDAREAEEARQRDLAELISAARSYLNLIDKVTHELTFFPVEVKVEREHLREALERMPEP